MRADAVAREFCGVAADARQAHPLVARLLFGAVDFARVSPRPPRRNVTCANCGIKLRFNSKRHQLPAPPGARGAQWPTDGGARRAARPAAALAAFLAAALL